MNLLFKSSGVRKFLTALAMLVGYSSSAFAAFWQPATALPDYGTALDIASDGNGHAIVAYGDDNVFSTVASYYNNALWSAPQTLGTNAPGTDTAQFIAVAMDVTGTGLVVWYEPNSQDLRSSYFNGTSFVVPLPDPLSVGPFTGNGVDVAMDGSGRGVAIWIEGTSVYSSFFVGGFWSTPVFIGTGDSTPKIAYSSNGTVIAGWNNAGDAIVTNYIGGSWQSVITLANGINEFDGVGIDANGRGLALWKNGTDNAVTSYFNGTVWQPQQLVFPNPVAGVSPALAMAPNGTAVVVWVDTLGNGISSSFNGTTWGAPQQYSSSGPVVVTSVSVDAQGNALAVYSTNAPTIYSAFLPLNEVWDQEEFVSDPSSRGRALIDPLVNDSLGMNRDFAGWIEYEVDGNGFPYAAATELPSPPTDIVVTSCTNKFASQTDRVNIITFVPSEDPVVVGYVVRRDGVVIGTVPGTGPFVFYDHNRCRGGVYVYTVSSVDISGAESPLLP